MGKRSTTSTKSGKFMNPTDQARKEQRRKELKKNKKQRMAVRHAVLKGKDAQKIILDLDEIDDMELNPSKAPSLSEKVLKDKRKKLVETFDRVLRLYEREEPEYYAEFKEMYDQYHERRARKQMYYDEVKTAERVLIDEIPLPEIPLATPLAPYDIPLPQPKSILKKLPAHAQDSRRRKPPGPPPGIPPALSDSEDEQDMDTTVAKKRSIRFQDEDQTEAAEETGEAAGGEEDTKEEEAKPVTPLQAAMLRMAAEKAAKVLEESQQSANDEEVFAEHGNVPDVLDEEAIAASQLIDIDPENVPLPASGMNRGMGQPMIYRGPGGAPVIGMIAPGSIRPPGMLPPGPPPGLPPAMRIHRLPGDLPPRLVRPHMNIPPPGMRPGMPQTNILSAPPSIMKPPMNKPSSQSQDSHATISAKPIIKHHIGDVTRFTPTSLKIKRDDPKKPVKTGTSMPVPTPISAGRTTQGPTGQTKDDAYDSFMKEIEGFI